MERYQPDQYGRMMPDAHGQWVSLRAAELTALDAAQKSSADAQATIAALQARVQELEARQHFGACAKCLTNAWRICKEGTPDAVEMKCSNGSTWWLCDYCLSKDQLTQRTAELEAARRERDEWIVKWDEHDHYPKGYVTAQIQLRERVQAELERVRDQYADLRKMVLALPKVEGEINERFCTGSYYSSPHDYRSHVTFETALVALLKHRQGMEG